MYNDEVNYRNEEENVVEKAIKHEINMDVEVFINGSDIIRLAKYIEGVHDNITPEDSNCVINLCDEFLKGRKESRTNLIE